MSVGQTSDFATKAAPLASEEADSSEKRAEDSRRRELIRISRAYGLAQRWLSSVSNVPRTAIASSPGQAVRWSPVPDRDSEPAGERGAQAPLPAWGPDPGSAGDPVEGVHLR